MMMMMMMMMMMFRVALIHRHNSQWTLPSHLRKSVVHTFTGGPTSNNDTSMTAFLCWFGIFILYFAETFTMLVAEPNRYYHWCTDSLQDEPSPQTDVTEAEMFVSGNNNTNGAPQWDKLTDYGARIDHFCTPFYRNMTRQQIFMHNSVSAFHRQQEWSWQDERKLWRITESIGHIWNSKQDILKMSQTFRKSGNWWSDCVVQWKGDFQTIYCQETHAF
jgi:hypothetical protein